MSDVFRYEARGRAGRTERGRIEASTREDALARLRTRGLTPLDLQRVETTSRASALNDRSARDLSRTLAQLLHSGLSLAQSLRFAAEELDGAAASVATRIRESVERGERPSEGLNQNDGPQARLLRGVLVAGEASGRLSEALDVAAAAFARAEELRARVQTALIYPCFVLAATGATLAIFVLFVTPALAQAFDGSLDKLPASTQTLLNVSAWLRANGLVLAAFLATGATLVWLSSAARRAIGDALDRLALSPLGGGVAARLDYATFARLSGLALSAGVPSAAAFEAGIAGLRSASLRKALLRAVAAIRVGERPSNALAQYCAPPRTLLKLTQVGEETGKLAQSLTHAADLLSAEAEQRLTRAGAVAGPIVTLGLGSMVGSVVLSLFLGLMSLSDVAAGQ